MKTFRRLARELEQRLQAQEARHRLEREFERSGVRDVDYAINLLDRETATMTEEQAVGFDEQAWLEKLRGEKAYLFGCR